MKIIYQISKIKKSLYIKAKLDNFILYKFLDLNIKKNKTK